MTQTVISDRTAKFVLTVDRFVFDLARHWLLVVNVILGVLVLAPFAAPALMAIGATGIADAIYFVYSLLCHQLPQRSFFLFGPKVSYSLSEIGTVWQYDNYLTLRQFIGNSALGWKVAWSDRMVAMYGSLWIGGILYAVFRNRLPRLSLVAWVYLGVLPMAVDGFSHLANDVVAGISGTGFRDTNAWLQVLTGNIFPSVFYAGDTVGSFNNLARLVTGVLFGLMTIWFIYPIVETAMRDLEHQTRAQLTSARAAVLGMTRIETDG